MVIPRDRFFSILSHTNNGFSFCSPLFLFIYVFILNELPEVPKYAKMQFHMMTFLDIHGKIAWV